MDYIYGVVNQRVEKNIYKGNSTDTAQVIVNNDDNTISVNAHVNYDEVHDIVNKKIGSLNVADQVQQSKFVTSVSEKNGLIEVKKSSVNIGNISGLPDRLNSIEERIDLLNCPWDAENPHSVATKVAQSKGQLIVESRQLVIEDIDKLRDELNSKADSKNAMHLLGTSTTKITDGGEENPTIIDDTGHEVVLIQKPSDVVIYKDNNIERKFICADDGKWHVLGSTNEFVRKDFINEDISNDQIEREKIKGLSQIISDFDIGINKLNNSVDTISTKIEVDEGNINELIYKLDETKSNLDQLNDNFKRSFDLLNKKAPKFTISPNEHYMEMEFEQ